MTERDSRGMLGRPEEKHEEDGLAEAKRGGYCNILTAILTLGGCEAG